METQIEESESRRTALVLAHINQYSSNEKRFLKGGFVEVQKTVHVKELAHQRSYSGIAHAGIGVALLKSNGKPRNTGLRLFLFLATVVGGGYGIFQLWLNRNELRKVPAM